MPGPDPILLEQRKQLPIWKGRQSLVRAVAENDTVVILGETGSGKTTQVPQFLLESNEFGNGTIAVTQPRKVAAISLATRVAAEQCTTVGALVGYSIRFDDQSSAETKIKYLTDGMLVRELLSDPLLSRYNVIIVDEAHERTLRTDLVLSALKNIQKERNAKRTDSKGKGPETVKNRPLKIIIMSATLDAQKFSKFFNNARILYVEGRQHPVKVFYAEAPQADYVESALRTFFQIHIGHGPGDVLIFLSGQEEIESLEKSITLYAEHIPEGKSKVLVCPLYAGLPQHQQNRIFIPAPPATRKVVLATNIAETSITIPGIRFVIDTGVAKEKSYILQQNRGSGMDMLLIRPISKSSAQQRAGRAGREGPGLCFRLYTEDAFRQFRDSATPEIQRCNLTFAVLQLKTLGQDPETTEFLDPPSPETIQESLIVLFGLEALDHKGNVTPIGREMSNFPLDPPLARALLASKTLGCTSETLIILSVLSASSKLLFEPSADKREEIADARSKFRHSSGDHLTLLNVVRAYDEVRSGSGPDGGNRGAKEWCARHHVNERAVKEAEKIEKQLKETCRRVGIDTDATCGEDTDAVLKSLLMGIFQNCAILQPDGTYRQTLGRLPVKIHPSSTLFTRKVPAIVYDELVFTSNTYARTVSAIEQAWLLDLPVNRRHN